MRGKNREFLVRMKPDVSIAPSNVAKANFFSYTSMDLLCEHGPARTCAYPEIFTLP